MNVLFSKLCASHMKVEAVGASGSAGGGERDTGVKHLCHRTCRFVMQTSRNVEERRATVSVA